MEIGNNRFFSVIGVVALAVVGLSGCAKVERMQNINSGSNSEEVYIKSNAVSLASKSILVSPDRSLGLEPTEDIRRGNISVFLQYFPKRLYAGEWFPGRLRHNTWTISDQGIEHFGQIIFSGMHPSGRYFGTNVIDGQVSSGITAVLSTAVDFIYSPVGKELAVEREKFQTDPVYRYEKIKEVNTANNGKVLNVSSLSRVNDFKWYIKTWNQLETPDGHLITPYGMEEIAKIRGINPQYSYFEKLVGTGKFAFTPATDPSSLAIINSIGILMDMIRAADAPSTGWDFGSHISRRQMSFVVEYALTLAEKEIKERDFANSKIIAK